MGMVSRPRFIRRYFKLFRLRRERVNVFAIDETGMKIGKLLALLFIAYEPFHERILELSLPWNPNIIAVEAFLKDLVKKCGKHPVWTDGQSGIL